MAGTILHVMNYAASYRGNFMDSLASLNGELEKEGKKNIYLFTRDAKADGPMQWIGEMQKSGEVVEFLSGNRGQDAKLIKKMMKEHGVVIVHTHFITMGQYLAVYQAVFGTKMPVVMHMHNHSRQAGNPVKNFIRQKLYSRCIMVACSESVYHSLERDYPGNEKYAIDNGVNFSRLDNYAELTNKDFHLPEGEKAFLIFGFDFFRKGVDLAVKALDKLRKEGHAYSLLVSLSTNFDQVEKNIVDILGEMPDWVKIIPARNDVATLYNFADLFLSPSREEGLPYSVIEAGYSKCSVVLSDISAQKYLKVPYGYWFESENVDAFAAQIVKAEQEHEEKIKHLEEARKTICGHYVLEVWSTKVMELYHRILEQK